MRCDGLLMPKIAYVIDDDAAVRSTLALLFQSVRLEVETFGCAEDFLAAYRPNPVHERRCLVVDVRMPGMSGLDLQVELRRRLIFMPVILISGHADVAQVVRGMRAGALTVLEKPVKAQDLIDAIHEAFNSRAACTARCEAGVIEAHRARLTARQRDVFDLLIHGLQTKEVARELGLSPRTVEVHRSSILDRLEVASFSQLLRQILGEQELH